MKNTNMRRAALLALMLASVLLLSSCYMSPNDITEGSDSLTVGSNNAPFQTIAVTPTPTPSPTPAQQQDGVNQVNWPDWGTSTETATPAQQNNSPTTPPVPTSPPSSNTQAPSSGNNQTADDGVLRSGDTGDDVKRLQDRLKYLGYYSGSVDGAYGAGTVNAVTAFQQVNGLTVDGIAGKQTQKAIFSYQAIPKPKTTTAATARVTVTIRPTATPNLTKARYLTIGYSGSDVRQVQSRLITLGYLAGSADGSYGEATAAAVSAYQKKVKGMWVDGKAGPDTQTSLFSSSAPKASGITAYVGDSLKEGMDGDGVRVLQKRLIALGYLTGSADGDFGGATKTAVTAFQQKNGLTADGIAGMATMNKLFASDVVSSSGSSSGATATPAPSSSSSYAILKKGDTGDAVKKLQQQLKSLGYYTGTVDGKYGDGTVTAVKSFQSLNGLTADGVAGPATQQRLYGDTSSYNKVQGSLVKFDEGTGVRDMQYALYELGYYQDTINGIYGESTYNAVREFQMINGLKVDGVAGNATLNLLFSIQAKPATAVTGNYNTLMQGSEGEDVALLQATLYDLGYMTEGYTGVYDDATISAVKTFQQYNGLPVDGIAGPETQTVLYSDAAVRNPLAP